MFNEDCPSVFPACPRIIAIGDIHGDIERLMESLYALRVIDTNGVWIAEPKNTIVVQLGDQVDSMNRTTAEDWEKLQDIEVVYFMDKLDRQARLHGGRVISLLGNHEIMNTQGDFSYVSPKSNDSLRLSRFRPGGSIANILSRRCVMVKIGSILFVHGGVLPNHVALFQGSIHVANTIVRKYLRGELLYPHEYNVLIHAIIGQEGILWTRVYAEHIEDTDVLNNILDNVLQSFECSMVCTGHNTVRQITPLCNGKLWFLDAGFSRAYGTTGFQVLEILEDGVQFRIVDLKK